MVSRAACSFLMREIHFTWVRGSDAYLAEKGLNMSKVGLLSNLFDAEGHELSLKELEKSLNRSQPAVARMANQLAENGYVEYVPDSADRRVKRVRLTQKGLDYREEYRGRIAESEEQLLKGMSPGERLLFRELLERVFANSVEGVKVVYPREVEQPLGQETGEQPI